LRAEQRLAAGGRRLPRPGRVTERGRRLPEPDTAMEHWLKLAEALEAEGG
jgi:hypothetical protein